MAARHVPLLALMATLLGLAVLAAPARGQVQVPERDPATLVRIAELVEEHYWRPMTRDSALAVIRAGGLGALDPYSAEMSRLDWIYLTSSLANSFGGIGMSLEQDSATAEIHVGGVFVGTPALSAGLASGDVILAVNGESVRGWSVDDVALAIRGEIGTEVSLDVRRQGRRNSELITLLRAPIQLPTVRGSSRAQGAAWEYGLEGDDDVAYIRILSFAESTASELDTALAAVGRTRARALVLDLRDSPGGLFRSAVQIADRFLDSGVIVTTRDRNPPDEVERAALGVGTRLPVAILISDSTKSAAEILAAALQDNGRAVVVGTRSYGKGLVQRLFPLADSLGGVRITTAAYHRPSGVPIERHAAGADTVRGGVWPDPDLTVPLSPAEAIALSLRLAEADELANMAHVAIDAPTLAEDPVLARARTALHARLRDTR